MEKSSIFKFFVNDCLYLGSKENETKKRKIN
jgi:hypothetical protein